MPGSIREVGGLRLTHQRTVAVALASLLTACAGTTHYGGSEERTAVVVTAHPQASRAATDVLERGGNAIDAAVAAQAMLGLVEPQSSGIGGGAFLLYYDARTNQISAYNGREKAPAAAEATMLLRDDGKPLARSEAMLGGRATGVPGVLSLLDMAHEDHGVLPWEDAFVDTIALARTGYPLTGRTESYLLGDYPQSTAPDVQRLFTGEGDAPLQRGETFVNRDYAETLALIAGEGATAFYDNEDIAGEIVARTSSEPLRGAMTRQDLRSYQAERVEPLCRPYRAFIVCVPPPPSSGVAVLQILGILEHTDIAERGPEDPQAWFLFAEASRLAYADRDLYVGDPAFVDVPVAQMLDASYLLQRRRMIGETAMPAPSAGDLLSSPPASDSTQEPPGTSHFVIADAEGNVVSMTTTIESYFGSGRAVGGFFLNNQMTDFAFVPVDDQGRPAANAVAGGKRPRSSMSPTIILDADGEVVAALGSPGGNSIIAYVTKAIVGMIDWDLPPEDAIALPNIVARGGAFRGEEDRLSPAVASGLVERGIVVRGGSGEESGLHAIMATDEGFVGGADPRRDGNVVSVPSRR